MPADEHLGQQFFHGSHEEFEQGAAIEPGQSGGYKGEQEWRSGRVWLADQPHLAEEWAPGGHIYRVQAEDARRHEPDNWDYEANVSASAALKQFHAARATVVGRAVWDRETRKYRDV